MTVTTVIAEARSLYPLTGVSDAVLTAWYSWALRIAGQDAFEDDRATALAHLLGHCGEAWARAGGIAGTPGGGVSGEVTASRSSTLSLSFGGSSAFGTWTPGNASDALLSTTLGGRSYLALRSMQATVAIPEIA